MRGVEHPGQARAGAVATFCSGDHACALGWPAQLFDGVGTTFAKLVSSAFHRRRVIACSSLLAICVVRWLDASVTVVRSTKSPTGKARFRQPIVHGCAVILRVVGSNSPAFVNGRVMIIAVGSRLRYLLTRDLGAEGLEVSWRAR